MELLARIGSGGMATVHLARTTSGEGSLPHLVAVKRAHPRLLDDEATRARLRREAAFTLGLHHPNVVATHAIVETSEELSLVLDYVEGASLAELVELAPLPAGVAARIVLDLGAGLGAVHTHGLVHRDVSPGNVLVGIDGVTRIADFGVARLRAGSPSRVVGDARGTFAHMAPEDIEEKRLDARADVFATAVIAWELLAGRRLFHDSRGELATMRAVLDDEAPPLSSIVTACAAFDEVVGRALAKNPEQRTPDIESFVRAFRAAAAPGGLADHETVGREVESRVDPAVLRLRRGTSRDGEGDPRSRSR